MAVCWRLNRISQAAPTSIKCPTTAARAITTCNKKQARRPVLLIAYIGILLTSILSGSNTTRAWRLLPNNGSNVVMPIATACCNRREIISHALTNYKAYDWKRRPPPRGLSPPRPPALNGARSPARTGRSPRSGRSPRGGLRLMTSLFAKVKSICI